MSEVLKKYFPQKFYVTMHFFLGGGGVVVVVFSRTFRVLVLLHVILCSFKVTAICKKIKDQLLVIGFIIMKFEQ